MNTQVVPVRIHRDQALYLEYVQDYDVVPPGGNVIGNQVKGVSILDIPVDNKEVALFQCIDQATGGFNEFKRGLVAFLVGLGETHGQSDGVENVETGVICVMNLYRVSA